MTRTGSQVQLVCSGGDIDEAFNHTMDHGLGNGGTAGAAGWRMGTNTCADTAAGEISTFPDTRYYERDPEEPCPKASAAGEDSH